METTKLAQHIKKTLAHTLGKHQYGIVTDEKNTDIVKTMVNYLQGLHDIHMIEDFSLSVVNVSDECISVSIAITQLTGTKPFLIRSDLITRVAPKAPGANSDFDRAMKGV